MIKSLRIFLAVFDSKTRRALLIATVLSAVASIGDFAALALLYPVFGSILSGGAASGSNTLGGINLHLGTNALVVLAVLLLAGRSVAAFLVRYWWGWQAAHAEVRLSNRVLSTYAFAPYEFHLGANSTELMSRTVANVNLASAGGLTGFVTIAADATSALAMTLALWVASPGAALIITLSLAAVGGLLMTVSSGYIKRQSAEFAGRISQSYTQVANVLRGIRELTVNNARSTALESVASARTQMVTSQRRLLILNEVPRLVLDVALYGGILVALFWALTASSRADVLPLVALYVVAGMRIVPSVARVLGSMTQVRSAVEVGVVLAAELEDIPQIPPAWADASPYPRGDLNLHRLSFGYGKGEPVIADVQLSVAYGSIVGLIGPSGGGKTTLLSIMLGLLDPTAGEIEFSGRPVKPGDADWFATIAYVPQDVYVVDDSVLANVSLGDPAPDRDRASRALEGAHLSSVVQELPQGLDTRLYEGGSRLSVGQRQRLGIARALYRDAKVLLLDEPTSALDRATEEQVVDTLLGLRGRVTMIVVAHRLSTLERADAVYELREGRLCHVGD